MSAVRQALIELKSKLTQDFEREMAKIDRAIAAAEEGETDVATVSPINEPRIFAARPAVPHMPISQAIVQAVNAGNRSPAAVKEFLVRKNILTTSNSVNTRLGKLRAAGKIAHDESGWKPVKKTGPEPKTPDPVDVFR